MILGISQISQVSKEGWLLKVHSEQDHFPSSEDVPDKSKELRELWLVEGGLGLGKLQDTEKGGK